MMFRKKWQTLIFSILILCSSSFVFASVDCTDDTIIQLVTKAKKELNDRLYLTLASADVFGSPWSTPLVTAFNQDYTFFWMSEKTSQHSKNIHQNNRVFAVVYDSTVPAGTGFGVYMQGRAYKLENYQEITYGIQILAEKIGIPPPPASDYQGAFPQRIYKFYPQKFWVNTVIEKDTKFVDRRIEITHCMRDTVES